MASFDFKETTFISGAINGVDQVEGNVRSSAPIRVCQIAIDMDQLNTEPQVTDSP